MKNHAPQIDSQIAMREGLERAGAPGSPTWKHPDGTLEMVGQDLGGKIPGVITVHPDEVGTREVFRMGGHDHVSRDGGETYEKVKRPFSHRAREVARVGLKTMGLETPKLDSDPRARTPLERSYDSIAERRSKKPLPL